MKKPARILAISALCVLLLPFAAYPNESDDGVSPVRPSQMTREQRRAVWESLSEQEKQAKREEWRAKREQKRAEWEAMTPEEREAKRAELRKKWESLTAEERDAIKERRKQRRHNRGKRRHKRDHGE
ncbi:MAG: hypothetical protein ACE5OQ_01875 [Woeseia sp.]